MEVWLRRIVLIFGPLLAIAGCGNGDDLPREPVSGTVALGGEPLEDGQIQFLPAESNKHPVAAGAPIRRGKYAISREEGLPPGAYKVMISAAGAPVSGQARQKKAAETEAAVNDGMPGLGALNSEERIPSRYNSRTELTAEVTAGGSNSFPFDLKK